MAYSDGAEIKTVDISNLGGETMASDPSFYPSKMEKLLANNNKLTTIPDELFSHTELNYLDLSYNQIAQIETIGKCGAKNVQTLLLSHNRIRTISRTTFNDLKNVTVLDLSFNNLRLVPESFDQLINLKNLSLAHTELYHFSFGLLAGCHQLESLDISLNYIRKVDIGLHSIMFRSLRSINMYLNGMTEIDGMKLRVFPSLSYMNLQQNYFNCTHLHSILSEFDVDKLILKIDRSTQIMSGPTVRGIPCNMSDEHYSPYQYQTLRTSQAIPATIAWAPTHPGYELINAIAEDSSMKPKNFEIALQNLNKLINVVLIIAIIIVTLIILLISGIILYFQPIAWFKQNRFFRQISRRSADDVQKEDIML